VLKHRRAVTAAAALVVVVAAVVAAVILGRQDTTASEPGPPPTWSVPDAGAPARALASPPGARLPSGEECARTIVRSGWEPVPENAVENRTAVTGLALPPVEGYEAATTTLLSRVDGDFTGTTDEIIEWAACKWGINADLIRAQAVAESAWEQSKAGDVTEDPDECVAGDTVPCPTSFGLLQLKHVSHPGTYPFSRESTAFNVDYSLAMMRACYEGYVTYFPESYRAGDFPGCLGQHFSGKWKDRNGVDYAEGVLEIMRDREWEELPNFPG